MTTSPGMTDRRAETPQASALCWQCPLHDPGQPLERLPVPAIPCGLTLACFGQRVLRWSTGSGAARRRMPTLTREELVQSGVTCAMAIAWRDFYLHETQRNPRNPSAPGRADLLRRVVHLLTPPTDKALLRPRIY